MRRLCSIGFFPAHQQPLRGVERGRVEAGDELPALARDAPQHRVDQTGIARRMVLGLDQPHREIDRRVVCHIEPQNLRRAEEQRRFDARGARRKLDPLTQ
jgi:hypothetical protein